VLKSERFSTLIAKKWVVSLLDEKWPWGQRKEKCRGDYSTKHLGNNVHDEANRPDNAYQEEGE
jgi:hypothetical protein